jgi:ABC-type bacteriocin/lantibiotic exporter with double-glycine peptidase domain
MKAQPKWSPLCGPVALRNALYQFYGKRWSIQQAVNLCELIDGTVEGTLQKALVKAGHTYSELTTDQASLARAWVPYCGLICVDEWSHWVVVHQLTEDLFLILDSENSKKNKSECHVLTWSWRTLNRRWKLAAPKHEANLTYFGIAIY